jgi:hypothetical protein
VAAVETALTLTLQSEYTPSAAPESCHRSQPVFGGRVTVARVDPRTDALACQAIYLSFQAAEKLHRVAHWSKSMLS